MPIMIMRTKNRLPLRRILITGATGAMGSALAEAYAQKGLMLYLTGRNVKKIKAVADRCRLLGAAVDVRCFDLRDEPALRAWIGEITEQGPVDLAILAAGINRNIGPDHQGESWTHTQALMDLNLTATMVAIDSLIPAMRGKGCGQIAIFSSLAGYFGLALTPSYCASKAALKAYGEALRGWLAPEGIKINVIMPGYVKSHMCDHMPGPKPFLQTPRHAAEIIRKGLSKNKPRITFPFPLNLGTWFLAVLPAVLSHRILRWLGYAGD
ncbi:SDR family NAD(P)-dependent oxidoreductase [Desulfosarcina sp. OttesenSCG-928-A07]|nr:SDR family NAD(P)-dependent oxidoreductase [Desulfosarcina sp. OttesenSCG-928-G17]MDL2329833.1 SDR family NAD(P)-dependent oxidoreductase [Desulfosarcina sp. OttesenSCG-928-A07]